MADLLNLDVIVMIVGAIITLMVFSYLLGDNILYRWALALLVGCGLGYVLGIAMRFVLFDWLAAAQSAESVPLQVYYFVPIFLGVLLLFKGFASSKFLGPLAVLGNISMGYLIGIGAAVAIAGALLGTLFPQIQAASDVITLDDTLLRLLQGIIMLVGTITSLLVFSPRPRVQDGEIKPGALWLQRVGRFFIVVALAATFAGAITSGLTLWVERWSQLLELVFPFGGG